MFSSYKETISPLYFKSLNETIMQFVENKQLRTREEDAWKIDCQLGVWNGLQMGRKEEGDPRRHG